VSTTPLYRFHRASLRDDDTDNSELFAKAQKPQRSGFRSEARIRYDMSFSTLRKRSASARCQMPEPERIHTPVVSFRSLRWPVGERERRSALAVSVENRVGEHGEAGGWESASWMAFLLQGCRRQNAERRSRETIVSPPKSSDVRCQIGLVGFRERPNGKFL
jgi:hypothetical protein